MFFSGDNEPDDPTTHLLSLQALKQCCVICFYCQRQLVELTTIYAPVLWDHSHYRTCEIKLMSSSLLAPNKKTNRHISPNVRDFLVILEGHDTNNRGAQRELTFSSL